MDHVAIDLGGRKSQICVRSSDGQVLEERKVPTTGLVAYLSRRPPSAVSMETCAEAFSIAWAAREQGHQVRVVPASLVKSLGVGSRGVKNDRRDAQHLSDASWRMGERLPGVHIPSQPARGSKSKVGMREALVASRTSHINVVRGWLRAEARVPATGSAETFGRRVREMAATAGFALPTSVERQLRTIEWLSGQIAEEDREIEQAAKADSRCQLLQTMPGIGPLTSLLFVAVVDEVERFPNAHMFESYLGLVPGEDSSSERERRTRITKAGSSALRRLLVQSAHTMRRCRPHDPAVGWSQEVEKRRGTKAAVVALARKMAGIAWAMLRDGTPYAAERAARPPVEPPDAESMRQALALLSTPPSPRSSRSSKASRVPKASRVSKASRASSAPAQ